MVLAACGGGEETANPDSVFDGAGDAADSGSNDADSDSGESSESGDSGTGTLENPTPEAPGALETNTIRIGGTVWDPPHPSTTGQCFTQEADGTLPDSATAWGDIDPAEGSSFAFRYNQDGSVEAEVSSNTMFWVAGIKDGSELTIDLDFENSTITGEGLFYNLNSDEWAYGSFSFACEDGG